MKNIRTILNLTPEAVAAIDDHAASPRRRGAWVSLAVREYARILAEQERGPVERIDDRLASIQIVANRILHALTGGKP